jgi:hypothetical protein
MMCTLEHVYIMCRLLYFNLQCCCVQICIFEIACQSCDVKELTFFFIFIFISLIFHFLTSIFILVGPLKSVKLRFHCKCNARELLKY